MSELQETVEKLIAEACSHPPGSLKRQTHLTQIIRLISNQLWRDQAPYYQDALQQTWIYFCRNLCEATTGSAYDPDKANVVTWLNAYLKRRLQDGYINTQKQRAITAYPSTSSEPDGKPLAPIDSLPAPPDIPPLLAEVQAWAEADADGVLACTHIKGQPQITCQLLILKRLPPETPWKELAAQLEVSVSTLSSFYQRQCIPLLKEFGRVQGYL